MSDINAVARDFTALLRAGDCDTAARRFRAPDARSYEPIPSGVEGAGERLNIVYESHRIDELSVDGPFVTGDQFALFLDMMIVDGAGGAARPFNEIALYTVRDAKITEERYFYD